MDRRDFLTKVAIGLPVAGLGGAAMLKSQVALATGTPPTPIYVASQYGTSSTDVQSAITAAASVGAGVIFEATAFTVGNLVLGGTGLDYPSFMIGYPGTILQAGSSVAPMIQLIDVPQSFEFGGFIMESDSNTTVTLDINGAGGIFHIHDVSMLGGTSAGVRLRGGINYALVTQGKFSRISVNGSNTPLGFELTGGSGQIYGNIFENCVANMNGATNPIGFLLDGTGSGVFDNTFTNCLGQVDSPSSGIATGLSIIDGAYNNVFTNFVSTASGLTSGTDINLGSTTSATFFGGRSKVVVLTSSSSGVIMTGQHGQSSLTGNVVGNGNVLFTSGSSGTAFEYDPNGNLIANKLGTPMDPDSHTPSGPTVRALPMYNASGTLLGYAPIYTNKW
ncbi:MAG TPA: hypothetical protein VGH91_10275 [Gammaproteobacteria bacterium]|jgi:hypothetical protein